MHILLSNDDGYQAQGITSLRKRLLQEDHRVTVMAPDRNRSACSSLLTVDQPLLPVEVEEDLWYVKNGSPADCIHLALGGFFSFVPDAVCAGINDSANLGDDTIYSGTVAAVLEARHLDCPKLAFSLVREESNDFDAAAEVSIQVLNKVKEIPHFSGILNVNIPALPLERIKGWRATRLGSRIKSHPITSKMNDQGERVYFIGEIGESHHHKCGTDFEAIEDDFVSITPLGINLTEHSLVDTVSNHLDYVCKS